MLDGAGVTGKFRKRLWGETFDLAVQWFNLTKEKDEEKCPEEKWSGNLPRWIRNLRVFGEIGIVNKTGHTQKVENKEIDSTN